MAGFQFKEQSGADVYGSYTHFEASGFIVDYDLTGGQQAFENVLDGLKSNGWLDEQTMAVIVHMNIFNPSTNTLVAIKLVYDVLSTGPVQQYVDAFIVNPNLYSKDWQIALTVVVFVIAVIMLIVSICDQRIQEDPLETFLKSMASS